MGSCWRFCTPFRGCRLLCSAGPRPDSPSAQLWPPPRSPVSVGAMVRLTTLRGSAMAEGAFAAPSRISIPSKGGVQCRKVDWSAQSPHCSAVSPAPYMAGCRHHGAFTRRRVSQVPACFLDRCGAGHAHGNSTVQHSTAQYSTLSELRRRVFKAHAFSLAFLLRGSNNVQCAALALTSAAQRRRICQRR